MIHDVYDDCIEFEESIHPCKGCEDYEYPNGCKSDGGCGSGWIPTRRKLPDKKGWYLVTYATAEGGRSVDLKYYTTGVFPHETVYAWMPLPEAYGGE